MVTRRPTLRGLCVAGLLVCLGTPSIGSAQADTAHEYQVKAAFLYNFAKFVEWPPEALPADSVLVGVLGDDPFGRFLDDTLAGKTCCQNRPLVAWRVPGIEQASNCQILFIGSSEEGRLGEILTHLGGARVLTVGDMDRFTDRGGMIGLQRAGNKIRFEINVAAATRAGLTISSQLLKLATRVISAPQPASH